MSERVAELEGVLQSGLKVIEQELRHLLESCCLIDKETLEPIRETLEAGHSETVVEMEAVIERATALLNKGEAQKGEGERSDTAPQLPRQNGRGSWWDSVCK